MTVLEQGISPWTDERLAAFWQQRSQMLCEPETGIVVSHRKAKDYSPFEDPNYPWLNDIGSLSSPRWKACRNRPVQELVIGNPFTPGQQAPGQQAIWDAAVAIPACRPVKVERTSHIQPVRNCNHWYTQFQDALKHVGPLTGGEAPLRPVCPYVFDITKMDYGWYLLEAAHVLAHLRGDDKLSDRLYAKNLSNTAGHDIGAVATVLTSAVFGLPLNIIKDPTVVGGAGLDIAHYGVDVRASGRFTFPLLRIPWCSNESPRPDATRAYLHVAVYIQPPPHTYSMEGVAPTDFDRWGCMPTMVAFIGWECVDYVTHLPLTSFRPRDTTLPVLYTAHPYDLLPPDTFWAFLAEGYKRVGPPKYDADFVDVWEWLGGKVKNRHGRTFEQLLAETPCLPCPECKTFDYNDPARIRRPDGFMPRGKLSKKRDPEWVEYVKKHKRLNAALKTSSINYLAKYMGNNLKLATKVWKRRYANHNRKLKSTHDDMLYNIALEKYKKASRLTKTEKRRINERRAQ